MATLTVVEAQAGEGAQVERRRAAATAVLTKAKKLSKGQRFLLRDRAIYNPLGFSPCGAMQERTTEILFERFGYLDRRRVDREDLGGGRFVPAYWLYIVNQAGKAALSARGIQFEVDCPDCHASGEFRDETCRTCHGTGKAPATHGNLERAKELTARLAEQNAADSADPLDERVGTSFGSGICIFDHSDAHLE
jgi:hypothetical protein